MVLKRTSFLLQQEEEEFGAKEGIHGQHYRNKWTEEKPENKRRVDTQIKLFVGRVFCHATLLEGTQSRE